MKKSSVRTLLLLRKMIAVALICFVAQGCGLGAPKEVVLPPTRLSAADLQFGRQQVDQMMHDRPEMSKCVERGDVIYTWTARQFAGEALGQRVYWSPELPISAIDSLSEYSVPYNNANGFIFIRQEYIAGLNQGKKLPCSTLWLCAIYELYNISHANAAIANYKDARAGVISKQKWVENSMQMEFSAMQKTKAFYTNILYPYLNNKGEETKVQDWNMDTTDNFKEWERSKAALGYVDYYSKYYDEKIAPYVKND